jgi:hypothetical protein
MIVGINLGILFGYKFYTFDHTDEWLEKFREEYVMGCWEMIPLLQPSILT